MIKRQQAIPLLDALFGMLVIFIAIVFLIKHSEEKTKPARPTSSLYEVVLNWDGKLKSDLDLHLFDGHNHVSFQRREGGQGCLSSLNHDSLGLRNSQNQDGESVEKEHEEIIAIRGLHKNPQEHIVNVHVYNFEDNSPVEFTVKFIKVKPYRLIKTTKMIAHADGEVYCPFRIRFDKNQTVAEIDETHIDIVNDSN